MRKIILVSIVGLTFVFGCKKKEGCTDSTALNYDSNAEKDDHTCNYNGQVTFWTRTDSITNNVEVTINGVTNFITMHYGAEPNCGSAGCATYNLTPGNYSFHAMEQGTPMFMWTSQVTVTSQGCTSIELHH
jgi:hypothetical protein